MEDNRFNDIERLIFARIDYDIDNGKQLQSEDINTYIDKTLEFVGDLKFENKVRENIFKDIERRYFVTHKRGIPIFNDYDNIPVWYSNNDIENPYFWNRYKQYLLSETSISKASIDLLDESTLPDIMNCLGNPKDVFEGKRLRRGLVIGDVQSGKTSTYIGLICKAADAGYKVVILLTGTTESLRRQTQERVDKGIIGYTYNESKTHGAWVGVGKYDRKLMATSFTSCCDDFVSIKKNIPSSLQSHNSLIIFVVKKNVSVLNRLFTWLKELNIDREKGYVDEPMLLIDDEADNASINTRADETDPTRTNKLIRRICNLFKNTTYVGFTATPFANVFIDPDSLDEMKNADLFPEHFIYALESPSNYIGADKIFYEDSQYYPNLCYITDVEEPDYTSEEYKEAVQYNIDILNHGSFYYKHKKEWNGTLPASLDEAVLCFFLANAIRDLRGQCSTPRSMMVNMSSFVKVQGVIKNHIEEFRDDVFNTIQYDFSKHSEDNEYLPLYSKLKISWEKHFSHVSDISFKRATRKDTLINAIKGIKIIMVNGTKQSERLNYSQDKSMRVIAVGGFALSRGLTLEGLMVSYFYRNTSTYDVLMQMGRWFGYRNGYEDLFQIWTTQTSAQWYAEVARSSQELKDDIREMFEQRLTPKDFGIKVRANNEELGITSYNKMRTASVIDISYSFYGNIYDTPYISSKIESNKLNLKKTKELSRILYESGYNLRFADIGKYDDSKVLDKGNGHSRFYENIPKYLVRKFLSEINISAFNDKFDIDNILQFIDDPQTTGIDYWDIVYESGRSDKNYDVPYLESIKCMERPICEAPIKKVVQISSKHRILSPSEGLLTLAKEDIELVKQRCWSNWNTVAKFIKDKNIPLKAYFQYLPNRKPMLIIMYIQPTKEKRDINKEESRMITKFRKDLGDDCIVTFAIGFPGIKEPVNPTRYKVNKTYVNVMAYNEIGDDTDEE